MQPLNTELILIRITGEDRPGLTASVTEILARQFRRQKARRILLPEADASEQPADS